MFLYANQALNTMLLIALAHIEAPEMHGLLVEKNYAVARMAVHSKSQRDLIAVTLLVQAVVHHQTH